MSEKCIKCGGKATGREILVRKPDLKIKEPRPDSMQGFWCTSCWIWAIKNYILFDAVDHSGVKE